MKGFFGQRFLRADPDEIQIFYKEDHYRSKKWRTTTLQNYEASQINNNSVMTARTLSTACVVISREELSTSNNSMPAASTMGTDTHVNHRDTLPQRRRYMHRRATEHWAPQPSGHRYSRH